MFTCGLSSTRRAQPPPRYPGVHVQTLTEIRRILSAAGLTPRKRFGQCFLIDANLMGGLLELADLGDAGQTVLEVGPGTDRSPRSCSTARARGSRRDRSRAGRRASAAIGRPRELHAHRGRRVGQQARDRPGRAAKRSARGAAWWPISRTASPRR